MIIKIYSHKDNNDLVYECDKKDLQARGFDTTQQGNMKELIYEWFLENSNFTKEDLLEVVINE